jgi:predicted O-linked N-acetylglucosamine transferase (SPINDLY family)
MDFYISADAFEPADAQNNYSEKLIRLPNLGVYAEPLTPAVENPDLEALELPKDQPLLLCPGTAYKYSPIHDRVWVSIAKGLREARSGRLVFFRGRFAAMDELFERRLRKAFDHERVKFDATVCVVDFIQRPQFFGLMQHSALMLDTLGFSGFNTAMQAVECGLPLLAYEGEFMRGRFASGIMRRMGLAELIAATDDEFIQKAIELAGDPARLQRLRREIADRRSVLFHDQDPIRTLEQSLSEAIAQS